MSIQNKIAQYRAYQAGIEHCTFNPDEFGVVRIHLVPPKFKLFGNSSHIVILNGYYILPIGYAWAILLSNFMKEVNAYSGKPLDDETMDGILSRTLKQTQHTYPTTNPEFFKQDLEVILNVLFDIAHGGNPDADIEQLSIRSYANYMVAPHRMDLMISAMTDEKGCWKCNQKCVFCYAAGQEYSQTRELSTDEWKHAIDRLKDAHVPMITFTGGEPTLRDDLVELVDYSKWFVTRLNTNGVKLTSELCAELKAASLDSVQITLYSADESVHNSLVGSTHYQDTIQGIQNAVAAGLDVSVNTPLCKKNADYSATISLLYRLGVRFVTLSGLICTGGGALRHEEYDLSENELYSIVKATKEFCVSNEMEMDFTSPGLIPKEKLEELSLNVPMCGAALSNMAIAPDGTVIPCQSWLSKGSGLGNILTDSWKKIWSHKRALALRRMSEDDALTCPFRNLCKEEQ